MKMTPTQFLLLLSGAILTTQVGFSAGADECVDQVNNVITMENVGMHFCFRVSFIFRSYFTLLLFLVVAQIYYQSRKILIVSIQVIFENFSINKTLYYPVLGLALSKFKLYHLWIETA